MPKRIFAVLYVSVMGLTRCYKTTVFLHLFPSKNQLTSICVSFHPFPTLLQLSLRLPSHWLYLYIGCLKFPKCFKYNTLFNALTRCRCHCTSDKHYKVFFVGLLATVCCYTNLHILFNNSRLYPSVAYDYFFVLTYRPKSITCSRCLNTKLHILTKLTNLSNRRRPTQLVQPITVHSAIDIHYYIHHHGQFNIQFTMYHARFVRAHVRLSVCPC